MFNNFNIEALTLRLINISQWENSIFFKATPELDIFLHKAQLDITQGTPELDIIFSRYYTKVLQNSIFLI